MDNSFIFNIDNNIIIIDNSLIFNIDDIISLSSTVRSFLTLIILRTIRSLLSMVQKVDKAEVSHTTSLNFQVTSF